MPLSVPHGVKYIIKKLTNKGFSAYIVGGAVRDSLAGLKEPTDWDIATSAKVDDIKSIFKKTYPTGEKHGTISVSVDEELFEVTTFREDKDYYDGRRPHEISFTSDITKDLSRRDFTINAMAYDIINNKIIDPFDGQRDLARGIIKAVGDPMSRIVEDPLRIMRAVRFASETGFSIDPTLSAYIKNYYYLLTRVSIERIRDEFEKILLSRFSATGLKLLHSLSITKIVLPLHCLLEDVNQTYPHIENALKHTFSVVSGLSGQSLELILAGLYHDVGKYNTYSINEDGSIHFYGHAKVSAELAKHELKRLRFPNKVTNRVVTLIKEHMIEENMSKKAIKRLLNRIDGNFSILEDLLKLRAADVGSMELLFRRRTAKKITELSQRVQEVKEDESVFKVTDLDINGYDIMIDFEIGGELVGKALNVALEGVLNEGINNNKKEISKYLQDNIKVWRKE